MAAIDADGDGTIGFNELRAFLRCYNMESDRVLTKSALVTVYVQNDFMTGALPNPVEAKGIVPAINGMRDAFDVVAHALDWHPYHHCSFVESVAEGKIPICAGSAETGYVHLRADSDHMGYEQELYPRHGVQKTWGSEAPKGLVGNEADLKVYMGTKPNLDAYTGFFDKLKANDTGLNALLEERGVTHVYVCGVGLDIAVKATALHAAELGYVVTVVDDACRPVDPAAVARTKEELKTAGVKVMNSRSASSTAKKAKGQTVSLRSFCAEVHKEKEALKVEEESTTIASHVHPPTEEVVLEEVDPGVIGRLVSVGVGINPLNLVTPSSSTPTKKTRNQGALARARKK